MSFPKQRTTTTFLSVLLALAASLPQAWAATAEQQARNILETTGVKGGLIVHLGCGDGALTTALRASDSFLVHGLDRDAQKIEKARSRLTAKNLYGPVSFQRLRGNRLPYADNLVRLVVAEDLGDVPMREVMRVLCPGGVAYVKKALGWKAKPKEWPQEIDEWTHALHGPDNNAVSHDTVVGPPRHLQWVSSPAWARSHDHLSSTSAAVSSNGRLFAIVDQAPAAAVALPAEWWLEARDAFSGILLWKRKIDPWEGHLRGFRTGPAAIQRRLVAVSDTVFVTLGYGKPVTALDAATGEIERVYEDTSDALEIVYDDGLLAVVGGPAIGHGAAVSRHDRGRWASYVSPGGKRLMAFRAESGDLLWEKEDEDTSELMPTALAVAQDRVFFENTRHLLSLDSNSGEELWRADRPLATSRWAWTAPTLVVYEDVVLSADRDAASKVEEETTGEGEVVWTVYSQGGESPVGKLMAFSLKTGKKLWETPAREAYNSPVDVLVADGLVWTGNLVRSKEPGITQGLDPYTGEVKRSRPPDSEFFQIGMGHHRCHRNKATDRFLVLGRSGVEWVDLKTGKGVADHWVRGACQYGVMPCNGLLYAPPHSCACYVEAKLHGFLALAPERAEDTSLREEQDRLEKGPAYGAPNEAPPETDDWPTYRHDRERTGRASCPLSNRLQKAWGRRLGGVLTSPVVAAGKVFLSQIHSHTVYALDAQTGKIVWKRTVGGRVDSPPTLHQGLCLFGCRDGTVYCLRVSDGALVWRFRAAPEDRLMVAYEQLESVWPVQGNILVHDGSAYFAAGRSSYIDGGIYLFRIDPATGDVQTRRHIYERDEHTGLEPQETVRGVFMPGALPDILSSDGESLYMRHRRFNANLEDQGIDTVHLFCPAGFLDGSWWHRTYFIYGSRMQTGWGGWGKAGYIAPAGRIMVVDDSAIYSFGRLNQYGTAGTHVGLAPSLHPWGDEPKETPNYVLFSTTKDPKLVERQAAKKRRGMSKKLEPRWTRTTHLWVRAMLVASDHLFLAGHQDPLAGGTGRSMGRLEIVSTKDGSTVTEYTLDSPPCWDALAAAGKRLYMTTTDGTVLCMREGP